MSLQYRAIWSDNRPDLVDSARPNFQDWVASKGINLSVPDEGRERADSNEVVVDRAADEDIRALRIRLVEEHPVEGGAERWMTTVHWMMDGAVGWVWVDVEWVSDAAFARPPDMAAPRLVRTLLEQRSAASDHGRLGPSPSRVRLSDVDDLVDWILHPDRLVPIVVYSVDRHILPMAYSERAKRAASRLAGCADVRMLTNESEQAFNDAMEPLTLPVFQGAVRVYLPGIDPDDPQPWKHRYTTARNLSVDAHAAANVVVRQILPRMAAQRPPEVYRLRIRDLLDRQRHDWQELAEGVEDELNQRIAEQDQLREDLRVLQEEKELLQIERDVAYEDSVESEREAERARRKLVLLRNQLRSIGESPESIELGSDDHVDLASCQDAIDQGLSLEHIVIHPDAPRDIERLDQSADSELWAQRIYRHLQALDRYAVAKVE